MLKNKHDRQNNMIFVANREQLEDLLREETIEENEDVRVLEEQLEEFDDESVAREDEWPVEVMLQASYEVEAEYGEKKLDTYYESVADSYGDEEGVTYEAEVHEDETLKGAQEVANEAIMNVYTNKPTDLLDCNQKDYRDSIKDFDYTLWLLMCDPTIKIEF